MILHVQVLLVIRLGCESCSFIMNDQFYGKIILPKFFSHFISISHFMTVCYSFSFALLTEFLPSKSRAKMLQIGGVSIQVCVFQSN